MAVRGNSMIPMVVDVDVIEADMIVVVMVPPSPTVRAPPWPCPGSKPEPVAESEAESHVPIVGEARAESIRAWTADPIASDVRRVVPARAIDYHVVWTDFSPEVA